MAAGSFTSFFESVRSYLGDTPGAFGGGSPPPPLEDYDLASSRPTQFLSFKIRAGEPDDDVIAIDPDDPNFDDLFGLSGSNSQNVTFEGPSGFGSENFVPADTALPYAIRYSHPGDASESVGSLQVIHQMDSLLDVRSFTLGDVILGDLELDLPDGRGSFSGEFDFTESRGFVLQVTAGLETITGVATWEFRAVDPITGRVVDPAVAGFLAPGETARFGYSIFLDPTAETGDEVGGRVRAPMLELTDVEKAIIRDGFAESGLKP